MCLVVSSCSVLKRATLRDRRAYSIVATDRKSSCGVSPPDLLKAGVTRESHIQTYRLSE